MRFWIKRNDTGPALAVRPISDVPIDLTGATAHFFMRRVATDALVVDAAATISGDLLVYDWQAGDTDIAGRYNGEFQVTLSSGEIRTFPNPGYIKIKVYRDLGEITPS